MCRRAVHVADLVGDGIGMNQAQRPNRVALVTGGSRGIGLAIARRLARDGVCLIVCSTKEEEAKHAAAQLRAVGAEAIGLQADVSAESSVRALFAAIEAQIGRLDILVNNAGVNPVLDGRKRAVEDMPLEIWNRALAVNLTGPFLVSRAAIPLLKRNSWGRIVNLSSRAGRTFTSLNSSHYAASKAGLAGLSRSLAGELAPYAITVNCVAPSRVDTQLIRATDSGNATAGRAGAGPLDRIAAVEDIANAVAFLCSDQADFITGTILDVNGGSFMAP